ncbi:MAG TPA: hypothetical protein VIU33_01920 [Nitrospiria bacterium]
MKKIVRKIGALFTLGAAAVVIYQIFMWFKTGAWLPMPVIKAILWVFPDGLVLPFLENTLSWRDDPGDWGLFQAIVLNVLKVHMSFYFLAIGLFAMAKGMDNERIDAPPNENQE